MARQGQPLTLHYFALDTANSEGKAGDAANHTLKWIKDDATETAVADTPAEINATTLKGHYKVDLTATDANCNLGTLGGESSTSDVVIIPTHIVFEGYQRGLY